MIRDSKGFGIWYVDSIQGAGFFRAKTPYDAFKAFIAIVKGDSVKVYKTLFDNDMLNGHGDPVWREHPEGDPARRKVIKDEERDTDGDGW